MENKTVAAVTLGCKLNQYETDKMLDSFVKSGYKVNDFNEKSDIYLINTCTVTNMADKKSRQLISRAKKMNDSALVVAVGCYVDVSENALKSNHNIDLMVKNNQKYDIVKIVEDKIGEIEVRKSQETCNVLGHKRALIKIQTGCNMFCSYCIIPYARGRSESVNKDLILEEAKNLVELGHKEIVITGIHIASFRNGDYRLIDLLEDLNKISGLERIRLGSLEPTIVKENFAKRISKLEKICPHFHLSLQSGDDEVLKRMNRKYKTDDFLKATVLLKKYFDRPSITTDIIVGFNGESDKSFENTLKFVKNIKFFDIHVFKYSKRKGTKAESFTDDVDGNIKNRRSEILISLKNDIIEENVMSFMNQTEDVLIEEEIEIDGRKYYTGYTMRYLKVYLEKSDKILLNDIVRVKIFDRIKDGVIASII